MKSLYEQLEEYAHKDVYGLHMPGHKRNKNFTPKGFPYLMDITEIDGFDDLHHPEGVIKEAEERAAHLYGSTETHFLVNGSTVGILSGILGCTKREDTILMGRNCHKSAYHAVIINDLHVEYIYPKESDSELTGGITPRMVEECLKNNSAIRCVVLVSPTYDGVVLPIKEIAEVVHSFGIPLIVDEAHGAHFGFHSEFPISSVMAGADVVIHSLHKTLPAMTQTALIHINGNFVNPLKIRRYLAMLQTSSPSYILMGSIDYCIDLIINQQKVLMDNYLEKLQKLRTSLQSMEKMKLLSCDYYDLSKLVIDVTGTANTGKEIAVKLRENYGIELEMTTPTYILGMTSICDTDEGLERFEKAILQLDHECTKTDRESHNKKLPKGEEVLPIGEAIKMADEGKGKIVSYEEAINGISLSFAYLYPPGIPFIVPGERVSDKVVEYMTYIYANGFTLEGIPAQKKLLVLEEGV